MHLSISKSNFLKELGFIQGVVERKNTIPILSTVLLEAENGSLGIKGTDLDVSVSTSCEAEITKSGSICLQAKKLFEVVRSLPEAPIELKVGEKESVNLQCERARFRMVGLPRDNFPEIQEFKGKFAALNPELLTLFISRTIFAMTNEESRYTLNGAKFEISENRVRMVTTDGHRLSFIEKQGVLPDGMKVDVIIPKKTLGELLRLTAETQDPVQFGQDENHLYFQVGQRLLVSRILSGQFPNYELVLPKENKNRLVLESEAIAAATRRVALMADEHTHAVRFEVSEGQVHVTAQSADVGEAGETLPVDYPGPAIAVGFNAQYLNDFFAIAQEPEVVFEFKDGNSQVQMRPSGGKSGDLDYEFKYIVMPMRI
jgi:DNA polymerase III subunit beta